MTLRMAVNFFRSTLPPGQSPPYRRLNKAQSLGCDRINLMP